MYDKYNNVTPIPLSTDLPKHKGILLFNIAAASGATVQCFGATGGTYNINVGFPQHTMGIVPISAKQVVGLAGTGWLLN